MFWFYYFGIVKFKCRYNFKLLINRFLLVICYLCCRIMRFLGLFLDKICIYVFSGFRWVYDGEWVDVIEFFGCCLVEVIGDLVYFVL